MNKSWMSFYEEFSNILMTYKDDRQALLSKVKEAFSKSTLSYPFKEHGVHEFDDVCPFTVMATINKGNTDENRIELSKAYKEVFDMQSDVPSGFDSLPVMTNLSAWFFAYKNNRQEDDIDNLWALFEAAIEHADNPNASTRQRFIDSYNKVIKQKNVKWNITMGLFWVRPKHYLSFDSRNRNYLFKTDNPYKAVIEKYIKPNNPPSGENYLAANEEIKRIFDENPNAHNDFMELSYEAFNTPFYDSVRESADDPLPAEPSKNYWLFAPGRDAEYWEEFRDKGIIAIGWEEIGDVRNYNSKKEIAEKLQEVNDSDSSFKNDALALWEFLNEMRVGDIVYAKQGTKTILGRGIVKSDYYYDQSVSVYSKIREVEWTHVGRWEYPKKATIKTLTNISDFREEVDSLEEEITKTETPGEDTIKEYDAYTPDDFLSEVFITQEKYHEIVSLLDYKKNLILQGPPGVGKTFQAKRIAFSMMNERDESRVKMIQFHQSYSYEDFIMGYKPTEHSFEIKYGPFYKFCKTAEEDNENDYFFIIDEINRGNLSKIFGELLMLIENDKRGDKIKLMYKDELFSVPPRLHIIGLMNTADRSLAMIDYALRRRFAFIDLQPAFQSEGFQLVLQQANNPTFNRLIREIEALNTVIKEDENLGEGFQIGHSYFTIFGDVSNVWLKSIINHEIIPLIKEYWFDDKEKVSFWASRLLEVFNA